MSGIFRVTDDRGLNAANAVTWKLKTSEFIGIRPGRQADKCYTTSRQNRFPLVKREARRSQASVKEYGPKATEARRQPQPRSTTQAARDPMRRFKTIFDPGGAC
jgi:hypothetical protein